MMSDHLMGRALTWVLAWAMSGPGPKPRPLRPIGHGGFYFTKFIGVVSPGFNLTGFAGVAGLGWLPSLTICIG